MAASKTNHIEFEKLVYGGDALGRADGRVVLAPFVLPGETAEVRVTDEKPGLVRAVPVRINTPSPDRVEAPCLYFGRCGGCHYQHAPYEYQVKQKREILLEALRRIGKIEAAPGIGAITAEPWQYRNRTQFHIAAGEIGYLQARSHRLCPVSHCPISSPKINEALAGIRGMMRERRWPEFVRTLELFTNEEGVQVNVPETSRPVARSFFEWCRERIPGATHRAIEYGAAGEVYRVSYRSFFQVNRFLIDRLMDSALEGAEGAYALDLFAGVGLFSLPLARRFGRVTAVESGMGAVKDLAFNARTAGVSVAIQQAGVEEFLSGCTEPPDFILADPPRAGLGKQVVRHLLRFRAPRLTIVACDPATLARDLSALIEGGYRIERMEMVDLFPQTFHIETVAALTLR
ncbi:MAG: class I SAM-dependent RNA methyltransferase [Bryobacteraceae bacterium]|nr:class I SAM-dependent RNA methyltransferase [Bryobacteraceae bacterium]